MAEPVLQEDVLVNFIVGDERLMAMAQKIAENINGVQAATEKLTIGDYFAKLAGEITNVGGVFQKLSFGSILTKAVDDANDMIKAVQSIGASAGMTSKQFAEMNADIAQAAAETGTEFGTIAEAAKDLYSSTGMKEGLGQTVLDAQRLGQVFGASEASFGKLTASMVQFGDGAVTADDVMKSFDKTTGITGKRMDDMLETLNDVAKTMRNVVGGGKLFGDSMKKITEFSTQVSAKFTEMGGDGAVMGELMKDVMDPNKWGDIAAKMPGMAGNLYEMQQAMASGDMEKFGKLMQAGAQQTADMGAGMSVVARSAAGIDFSSAEMLTKIDFKKMGQDASGAGDVMARSAEMLRSTGDEMKKFFNNLSKSLMPVLLPVLSFFSAILSGINRFMQAADGWVGILVTWGILAIGIFLSVRKLLAMIAQNTVKAVADSVGEAAKGVGKAAGEAVGSFMDSVGKAVKGAAAYALPMMQIGAAMLLLAGAVYILAQAMVVLMSVKMSEAIGPLLAVIGLMAVFALASVLLAPIAPAMALVGLAFLLFAGAVYVLAQALRVAAPAFDAVVGSLGKMADLPLGYLALGLYVLTPALLALLAVGILWGTAGLVAVAGLYLLGGALLLFGSFADSITNFSNSVKSIGDSAANLEKFNNLNFDGLVRLGNALKAFSEIKIDVEVSSGTAKGITSLIGIVKDISSSIVEIITAGSMAIMYATQMNFIFDVLFNKNTGILINAVKGVNASLVEWNGNITIPKNVQESLSFVMTLMDNFSKIFIELATMGTMLLQDATLGTKITKAVTFAIATLSDIVLLIDTKLVSTGAWGDNKTIPQNVRESLTFVLTLMGSFSQMFIDLAVMGTMLHSSAGVGQSVTFALTYAIATISDIVALINDKLVSFWGNTTIPPNVLASMNGVLDIVKNFSAMFIDLAVMGTMLAAGAGQAGGVGAAIDTAISSIFGDNGFIKRMMDGMKGQKIDPKAITDVSAAIKGLGDLTNPLIEITAMGGLFKGGLKQDLFAYADTIGEFLSRMHTALDNKAFSMPEMMGKLGDFKAMLSEDVKISTKTGADLALSDHTTATAEHQQTVEALLKSINDNIQAMGRTGSKEVAAINGNVPAWHPEHLFADVSGTF